MTGLVRRVIDLAIVICVLAATNAYIISTCMIKVTDENCLAWIICATVVFATITLPVMLRRDVKRGIKDIAVQVMDMLVIVGVLWAINEFVLSKIVTKIANQMCFTWIACVSIAFVTAAMFVVFKPPRK